MNKKTRSTKSKKWRQTCNSVEIAWTNEQKVAVTSYGRNKHHDDEIKKTKRRPIIAPAIAVRLLKRKISNYFFFRSHESYFLLLNELNSSIRSKEALQTCNNPEYTLQLQQIRQK